MSYLKLVSNDTMITVREGMDDIPELQYVTELPLAQALEKANLYSIGYCDDRWALFGLDDQELDMVVKDDKIVAFAVNYDTPYTPTKFALPDETAIKKFYSDLPF